MHEADENIPLKVTTKKSEIEGLMRTEQIHVN
jgi:hypothetical protein